MKYISSIFLIILLSNVFSANLKTRSWFDEECQEEQSEANYAMFGDCMSISMSCECRTDVVTYSIPCSTAYGKKICCSADRGGDCSSE